MSLRSRLRSVIGWISSSLGASASMDHPSDGGITGDVYPESDVGSEDTTENSTQT